MNTTQLIKSNAELSELPFLVVFRTIQVLREIGVVKLEREVENDVVDSVQP